MNQAGLVRLAEGIARLAQEVDDPTRRQRAMAIDQFLKAQAGQIFHHIIKSAVLGAAVVEDLDRVPVRQPGRRPHLELEPGQYPGLLRQAGANQLDGAGPFQKLVLGEVNLAHPPGPQLLREVILVQPPGPELLLAKRVDGVCAEDRRHGAQYKVQGVLGDLIERARLFGNREKRRRGQPQEQGGDQRRQRHGYDHQGRPAPVVGNEDPIA